MKRATIITAMLIAGTTSLAGDAISNLVNRLNAKADGAGILWMNGAQPSFKLSSNSTPPEVVHHSAIAWRVIKNTNDVLRIIEIRPVDVGSSLGAQWMAAEIEVNSSKKVLLFRSIGVDRWWTRFYDEE